jgi:mono/diheme cytochrome c family protein
MAKGGFADEIVFFCRFDNRVRRRAGQWLLANKGVCPPQATGKTTLDGVFSDEQMKRGAVAYVDSCSGCHRNDLSGAGNVLRSGFMNHWISGSLDNVFSYMKTNMPANNPGSLKPQAYTDILAFILSAHGFPSGTADLTPDALKDIKVVNLDGSAPSFAPGALGQTYGCLAEGPDKTWQLTNATALVRTKDPDKSSDKDLKQAETAPAGTATFALFDITHVLTSRTPWQSQG